MKSFLTLSLSLFFIISCNQKSSNDSITIGSANLSNGTTVQIIPGDTSNEQRWVDYIKAHNDRDLEKIAEINADDWKGYTADGSQLKGNKAHIEVLDNWFKTANPRWEIKWMIANAAEDEDGVLTQWLTTGNDYFDTDQNGNEIFQHNIHDIKFVDGKIKEIYVYSREKAKDSSDFSY